MTRRLATLPLVALAVLGLSACASKKKDLPPPPPTTAPATTNTTPGPAGPAAGTGESAANVGTANVPGSAADFAAQSGSDHVLFAYDSYELDDEARAVLGKQAEWLARYPDVRVTIEGHADERGTREYNLALGDRRATAAKNFLAAQGVAAARMNTISYGKEKPSVEGSDESAWAQNRRAVTVVATR